MVILKHFGRVTKVITNKSANAIVADFEYVSPRQPPQLFIPMRLYVPYGSWIEEDGSTVLYSRDYFPIWRITPTGQVSRPNPWERIKYELSQHFWDDSNTPWRSKQTYQRCVEKLESLHLIGGLPRLVDALPLLILEDTIGDEGEAVGAMKARAYTDDLTEGG